MTYPPASQPDPRWPQQCQQPHDRQSQPYYQQPYYQPQPQGQQINVIQQNGRFPGRAVTRRPLSSTETCFHAFMTLCTSGLWGFVWWGRVRSRRSITTWQ